MDFEQVADELYGVPLGDFTATRTARAKEAKTAGDKELSARIARLAKPNQAAWLSNQLVRRHREEIQPLLDLGAELRDAAGTLTPDQLQEFTRQQRQLVSALVSQARRLGSAEGKRVSDDTAVGLQSTLQAALADPDAAARLLEGRLVEGMQHVGFGPGLAEPTRHLHSVPPPRATKADSDRKPRSSAQDKHRQELETAQEQVRRAQATAREAAQMRDDAKSELDKGTTALDSLQQRTDRLRDELDEAEAQFRKAERDQQRLRKVFERSESSADDAVRRLERAEANLRRIAEQGG